MTDDARIRELMLVNLFAVFNERSAERRLKAIADNYTEDVIWTDPDDTTHGQEAMNERARGCSTGCPISCSRLRGRFTSAATWVHLAFNLGVLEQPPAVSGYDVARVRDGRIAVLYTLVSAKE
jgi:SnoaL-like domain